MMSFTLRKLNYCIAVLTLILLFQNTLSLHSKSTYYFKTLSIDEGLSQTMVNCILCDHEGGLWIGTKYGLNLYHQYNMKSFYHQNGDKRSIPGDLIHFVTEDKMNNIWIGSDKGLCKYNRSENNFEQILYKNILVPVYSFVLVGEDILFGAEKEIFKYNQLDNTLIKVNIDYEFPKQCSFNRICRLNDHFLILSSSYKGTYLFNCKTNEIKPLDFIRNSYVTALYVDSRERIWLSNYNDGLECYDITGNELYHLTSFNSGLSYDIVLDMMEKDGSLWIGTDGGGINIFNEKNMTFEYIAHNGGDIYSLPSNSIKCIQNDRNNNLWIGTIKSGLVGIKETDIKSYRESRLEDSFGISNKSCSSIYCDDDYGIWIGTDGGGLNLLDPDNDSIKHIKSTFPEKIVSISPYDKEMLLLSFFAKGLFLYNKITGSTTPFIIKDRGTNSFEVSRGISLGTYRYASNKFIIMGSKVYLYDSSVNRFDKIQPTDEYYEMNTELIYSNEKFCYLMGERHIAKLDYKTAKMSLLGENITNSEITSACYDGRKYIYYGSSDGLGKLDVHTGIAGPIESNVFNNVTSLTYDNGRLWVGAQNMLFCYIPSEDSYSILSESDGFLTNELSHIPQCYVSYYNKLFLGGTSGVVSINRDIQIPENKDLRFWVTDIIIDKKSCLQKLENNIMKLPWNRNSLTIEIASDDKDIFRKKIYRYEIEGLNAPLVTTYNSQLNVTSLPVGNYKINVSTNSLSSKWSTPITVLEIEILPPWWQSLWFYISIFLSLLSILIVVILYIFRRNRMNLKREMRKYETKMYEDKIRFLINISHELLTPLTLIYAPLKSILDEKVAQSDIKNELINIFRQSKAMKNTINMVLNIRKIEVGNEKLHFRSYNLHEWIKEVVEGFRYELNHRNIQLEYNLCENIHNISFDASKCEIVLSNMLMNALKYSDSDTSLCIRSNHTNNGQYVRISVIDQGIGLSNIDVDKLFTRFYRGDIEQSGNGIGLSYAKTIIDMHNGNIGAFDNQGEGATFYFELPYSNEAQVQNLNVEVQYPALFEKESNIQCVSEYIDTKMYSIMIVEDNHELNEYLKKSLTPFFKKVYTVFDGDVALNVIKSHQPDIIISDIFMPKKNGYELCAQIKNDANIRHLPIILLTAAGEDENKELAYELGVDAYVTKPFDIDFLLTITRNILKNRNQLKLKYKNQLDVSRKQVNVCNADEEFMIKINLFIRENLENPDFDVRKLASEMAVSRSVLYTKFKAITDMGINDYINMIRIQRACQLLTDTNLSIREISEQTGFIYQRYFTTVFKQQKGVSPSHYRKNKDVAFSDETINISD